MVGPQLKSCDIYQNPFTQEKIILKQKKILCIPIVCKYFIYVVSMAKRKKNSKPCFHTLFEVKRTKNYYLKMLEIIKKIIVNLITVVQNYCHLLVKDKYVVGIFFNI
jgi:hypothetical protein